MALLNDDLLPTYVCIVLAWVGLLVMTVWGVRRMVTLTAESPKLEGPDVPLVSLLVPARNESANILACLESLLAQTYPNWELLVIDDRSTDDTAQIVEALAARDPRVRLLRIESLPEGWTGKNHALHEGAKHVGGEYLLFVDADTQQHRDNVSILLAYARREQADLVTLIPAMTSVSFWERVVHPLACVVSSFFNDPLQTNDPSCLGSAYGNGQYMLFRRTGYDTVGGHESVRTEFVEDMYLARRVKRLGLTLKVVVAPELSRTRMFGSLGEVYRGWSRILYGSVDRRPWRLILLTIGLGLIVLSAFAVWPLAVMNYLAKDGSPRAFDWLWLSTLHQILIVWVLAPLYRLTDNQRRYLFLFPVAFAVLAAILFRAIWLCFTHRVNWRGTQYGANLR